MSRKKFQNLIHCVSVQKKKKCELRNWSSWTIALPMPVPWYNSSGKKTQFSVLSGISITLLLKWWVKPKHNSACFQRAKKSNFNVFLIAANFGGVMGCAVGMTLAAAIELIYWLILKPLVKCLVSYNVTLSAKSNLILKLVCLMLFLSWLMFSYYYFNSVYSMYINR